MGITDTTPSEPDRSNREQRTRQPLNPPTGWKEDPPCCQSPQSCHPASCRTHGAPPRPVPWPSCPQRICRNFEKRETKLTPSPRAALRHPVPNPPSQTPSPNASLIASSHAHRRTLAHATNASLLTTKRHMQIFHHINYYAVLIPAYHPFSFTATPSPPQPKRKTTGCFYLYMLAPPPTPCPPCPLPPHYSKPHPPGPQKTPPMLARDHGSFVSRYVRPLSVEGGINAKKKKKTRHKTGLITPVYNMRGGRRGPSVYREIHKV